MKSKKNLNSIISTCTHDRVSEFTLESTKIETVYVYK